MVCVELVEFINSQRKPGEPELRHDNFMAKVPKVLGEAAPKFLGTAPYTNGTGAQVSRQIYIFPKREACLMAISTRPAAEVSVLVTGALPICFAVPRPATRAAPTAAAPGMGLSCQRSEQNSQKAPT